MCKWFLIGIKLIGIATKKIYGPAHTPNTPRCIRYFALPANIHQHFIYAHLDDDCGMMSIYYPRLSRRIPALSKSCHCSVKTQLLSRLARNVSSSTRPYVRSNVNGQSVRPAIKPRYSSTGASIDHLSAPPTPVQHPEIVIKDHAVEPRDEKEDITPPLPPTSISLHADILPISCPGCGAYAQTIDPNEPGYYSRTRKKAKQQWHKRQQVIAKEQRAISTQDDEALEDEATGVAPIDKGEFVCSNAL